MAQPNQKPDFEPDIRPNLRIVDDSYKPDSTADQLANAESRPNLRAIDGGGESTPERASLRAVNDINDINDAEQAGSATKGGWDNKVTPQAITNQKQLAKLLIKRGGPAGAVLALILVAGSLLGGIIAPGSLFLNLKENLTLHWDQQNYTAEVRSRAILAKRLGGEGTSGACRLNVACRYTKPSNKMLNDLADAGIQALDGDGSPIERQRLLNGDRPAHYVTSDGLKVTPKDFRKTLQNDARFRSAFRRAYNPRWVNWFDDTAMKFLQRIGINKAVNSALVKAVDSNAVDAAIEEIVDGKKGSLGEGDEAAERAMRTMIKDEASNFTKTAAKDAVAKGHGDSALTAAAVLCASARAPGLVTSTIRKIRLAQMAAVVFPVILVTADAIKADDADPNLVERAGMLLTSTALINVAGDMVKSKSAMDSGAMLYGLIGDRGSAAKSTTAKKYIPGNTGNPALNQVAAVGQSKEIKQTCNMLTSTEAAIAVDALKVAKVTNAVGWVMLGVDLLVWGAEETGLLDYAIDTVLAPNIAAAVSLITGMIDMNAVASLVMGDTISGAKNEEFGDMAGVLSSFFADAANSAGNVPLTATQKVEFDNTIVNPTRVAWAEEDRLTHSPFDASNPNTFLGSITTQVLPYYSSISSFTSLFTSAFKLVGSAPGAFITPNAYAAATEADWTGQCPVEADYAIATSDIAAGPLCDVQYAVPTEYISADPEEVARVLYENNQIDADGNIKPGSNYENWVQLCTTGNTYSLSQCVIPTATKTVGSSSSSVALAAETREVQLYAYMSLYHIDQRVLNGMDNELPAPGGGDTAPIGEGSTDVCDPRTIDMGVYNNAHDDGKKASIKLCAVPNLSATGYQGSSYYSSIKAADPAKQAEADGKALVNAKASGATYAMVEAAKTAGVNLTLGTYFAFRSYEHQVALKEQWKAKGDPGGAADPGYSNHEMGLAIDFYLPGEPHDAVRTNSEQLKWLRAHANEYGFDDTAMPKEDWHWSYAK